MKITLTVEDGTTKTTVQHEFDQTQIGDTRINGIHHEERFPATRTVVARVIEAALTAGGHA